jgi:hypothetical protein
MADGITPVGAMIQAPNPQQGINTLSAILGVRQQRQALETGQAIQQSAQAKAVQDQQAAIENQAGAKLLSDPIGNGITDADGNVQKGAQVKFMQAMPTTGAGKFDDFVKAATGNVQYKNAWLGLRQNVRQDVSARLAGTAADPQTGLPEIHDTLDAINADYKGTPAESDVNAITGISKGAIDDAATKHGIQGAKSVIMNFSRGGLANSGITGTGGVAAGTATTVQTATGQQPGVTAPPLAGGGFTATGPELTAPPSVISGPGGQLLRVPRGATSATEIPAPAAPGTWRWSDPSAPIESSTTRKRISPRVRSGMI